MAQQSSWERELAVRNLVSDRILGAVARCADEVHALFGGDGVGAANALARSVVQAGRLIFVGLAHDEDEFVAMCLDSDEQQLRKFYRAERPSISELLTT